MNYFFYFILAVSISGKVFNIDTQEPLPAHIYITELDRIFVCDTAGKFFIENLSPDNYTIITSHIGFKEDTLKIDLKNYQRLSLSIGLQIIPISLEPLRIIERKSLESGVQTSAQQEIQIIPGAIKDVFHQNKILPK
ncbi:MAG: carboxypeptidase-like regulatory domain-containing protein [bacterium]